ncbi:MAG: M23 family metallopeptidase [Thermodesulfovibrionales bacterium]|nr:M23 family metallopeptidase [Thermodesulfovibrionales bacterium]
MIQDNSPISSAIELNKYQIASSQIKPKDNPENISQQIEKVFLNELLKNVFEHTEFGKNKAISPFIPFFTAEISHSFAVRGIGVGEFLTRTEQLKSKKDNRLPKNEQLKETLEPLNNNIQNNEEKNTSLQENNSSFDNKNDNFKLTIPVDGSISSTFGKRLDPFIGKWRQHNGIDIAIKEGSEVKTAASGKVAFVGEMKGYGKVVIIEHDEGYSSIYGHNSKNLVEKGQMVEVGQVIALSGATGRATGPHLHFEVRKDGEAINPLSLIG